MAALTDVGRQTSDGIASPPLRLRLEVSRNDPTQIGFGPKSPHAWTVATRMTFEPRTYRNTMGKGRFRSFTLEHMETDLWIGVDPGSYSEDLVEFSRRYVRELRVILEGHIKRNPDFHTSLIPLSPDPNAPPIVREMIAASARADVGPMASVAGAFSQYVGIALQNEFGPKELVIENGGDIYMKITAPLLMSVYAGASPLSEKIGVMVTPEFSPLGICTSSGTVGHSFSFGKADAVMIACRDTLLADSYATAFCNRVKAPEDIEAVLDEIGTCDEILSAVVVMGERMGIRGKWGLEIISGR